VTAVVQAVVVVLAAWVLGPVWPGLAVVVAALSVAAGVAVGVRQANRDSAATQDVGVEPFRSGWEDGCTMSPRTPKADPACVFADDIARQALVADVGAEPVGEHLGHLVDDERVVTHLFAARQPGYDGWRWAVTVARASRARAVSIDEIVLIPGPVAIVAPPWVPWAGRVTADDLGPGDLLPSPPDDPRLVPAYAVDEDESPDEVDDEVTTVVAELGLGRARVLSLEGRDDAAERWWDGDGGPDTTMAKAAPGQCSTCGFLLTLRGPLAAAFGVCGNEQAPRDGRIVSLDHGCGAHSEQSGAVLASARATSDTSPGSALDTVAWDV